MNYYYLTYLASVYGAGDYGSSLYSCTTQEQQAGTCGTNSSTLVNTGIAVAGFVTLACLIIFVALVVRVWKRKKKPTVKDDDKK